MINNKKIFSLGILLCYSGLMSAANKQLTEEICIGPAAAAGVGAGAGVSAGAGAGVGAGEEEAR